MATLAFHRPILRLTSADDQSVNRTPSPYPIRVGTAEKLPTRRKSKELHLYSEISQKTMYMIELFTTDDGHQHLRPKQDKCWFDNLERVEAALESLYRCTGDSVKPVEFVEDGT